jgi:PRC-barrel domain protein
MAHYATLNEYRFAATEEDVRGAILYGEDGEELGRIRDVVFDHASGDIRYFVVEYGRNRRVLVPLDRVFRTVMDEDSFSTELMAEDLDRLPAFDEKLMKNDRQWRDYEKLHHSTMSEGSLEARAPQRSKVTPINRPRNDYRPDIWPQRLAPIFGSTGNDSGKIEMVPHTQSWQADDTENDLGERWNQFADQVKRNLNNLRGDCERCKDKDTRAA